MKFCRACKTSLENSEFAEDGRTKDGLATRCTTCVKNGISYDDQLEVEDLLGVEIMAAGERVRGAGSPEEGEVYSEDDLSRIAADTNEVVNELRPFVKIGHSKGQALAKASGLYDEAESPATGWPRNFRVQDGKLVSDFLGVPKTLARLVKSGAFRFRSTEVRSYKDKPIVVSAVALLGAKAPAFKTLRDVAALYSDATEADVVALFAADEPLDETETRAVDYAEGDLIWDPEKGAADLMEDLTDALNPDPPGPPSMECAPQRYWCMDVILEGGGGRALVRDSQSDSDFAWVVPFTMDDGGEPKPADFAEWTLAQQAWIQRANDTAAAYAQAFVDDVEVDTTETTPRVDTTPQMTKVTDTKIELNDEARKHFAEALGLPEDATAEQIDAKLRETTAAAKAAASGGDSDDVAPTQVPAGMKLVPDKEYAELMTMAREGATVAQEVRLERRDALITAAIKDGRLDPAQKETWEKRYDEAPELTKQILSELPKNEALVRAYGNDDDGDLVIDDGTERAYAEYCATMGLPYHGPIGAPTTNRESVTA